MTKDRRLGRGLAALLGNAESVANSDEHVSPEESAGLVEPPRIRIAPDSMQDEPSPPALRSGGQPDEHEGSGLVLLNVYEIDDNPFQPRRDFSESEIASLAESLKSHQMLQPVLVRRAGERFQLISGERRLRAAIQAGWSQVPAQIRDADDRLVAELAIVENLQRKDLNPIEKALSFRRYLDEHGCTQEELAERLKIDRSTISNLLRLLELPQSVCNAVRHGRLTAGHARALLPLGDEEQQMRMAEEIERDGLSVRATESRVTDEISKEDGVAVESSSASGSRRTRASTSDQVAALEQEFRRALGTRVDVRQSGRGRGRIVVHFKSHAEFERLRDALLDREADRREAG